MKIIKFSKGKSNQYTVYFDDGEKIKLFDDIIIKFNLLNDKELDQDKLDEILKVNDKTGAYYKALRYINKRLRTENEVYNYLVKDYTKNTTNEIIDRLKAENYFDKDIYIKSYINDQVNLNLVGPYKIRKDLIKLGFDESDIDSYLNNISDKVWLDKVEKIISKKVKSNHQYGISKLKEKIYYEVSNLGFSKEMIEEYINDIEIDNNDMLMEKEFNKQYIKLSKKFEGEQLYFQIKAKIVNKGFNYYEVDEFIAKRKNVN